MTLSETFNPVLDCWPLVLTPHFRRPSTRKGAFTSTLDFKYLPPLPGMPTDFDRKNLNRCHLTVQKFHDPQQGQRDDIHHEDQLEATFLKIVLDSALELVRIKALRCAFGIDGRLQKPCKKIRRVSVRPLHRSLERLP